ncbi:MAG: hypothetical protein JW920_05720 [Deltaproteobacteria bacterium]|nr:hypothetical protein [Deltaproteobacteria bacterium]
MPGATVAGELMASGSEADMIEVEADMLDVNTDKGEAIFQGDVKARRGDMVITSKILRLYYDNATHKVNELIAEDEVVLSWQDKKGLCNKAVYLLDEQKIMLLGNVNITRGNEMLSGQKVTFDMATDRQIVEGQGGRVKIRINPTEESGILQWEK